MVFNVYSAMAVSGAMFSPLADVSPRKATACEAKTQLVSMVTRRNKWNLYRKNLDFHPGTGFNEMFM
jgi:hypothetical protein